MKRNPKTQTADDVTPPKLGIDAIVQQFERAWTGGERPSIVDWLNLYPEVPRRGLLEALLFEEWGIRRKRQEDYALDEYVAGSTLDRSVVERAWMEFHAPEDAQHSLSFITIDAAALADKPSDGTAQAPICLGRFVDVRRLGSGGMGMVFTAFDPERNTKVALKTIKNVGGEAIYRFKREFRALADIAHPNLCPLYELLMIEGVWFITMPFIDGKDLVRHLRNNATAPAIPDRNLQTKEFLGETVVQEIPSTLRGVVANASRALESHSPALQQPPRSRSSMRQWCDEQNVRDIFAQITRGMMALHQSGRLHRDLKPANVLVDRQGHAFILDFGLVSEGRRSHLGSDDPTPSVDPRSIPNSDSVTKSDDPDCTLEHISDPRRSRTIEGTPQYMAPEQAMGRNELTPACDWYALGVMLFEVLTGDRPFTGSRTEVISQKQQFEAPNPDAQVSDIPRDLSDLCARLLQRDPKLRPTGSEILHVLTGSTESAPSTNWTDQQLPFVGREHLLSTLSELTHRVRTGQPAIVRIHGRSGAGKSSVVQRFLEQFQHPTDLVLLGRCYEQESVPHKALDGVMDSLSNALADMSPGTRRRYTPDNAAELARVFEVLQRLPEWYEDASHLTGSEPGELRRRAMSGLRDLLCRLSEDYLVIIAIDDFQWGDTESAGILLDLLCNANPPKVLLLISYRDEYESTSECLGKWLNAESRASESARIVDMPVGPLTEEEATSLASELLPMGLDQREAYLKTIVRESSGNPFFVIELAMAAARGRTLPIHASQERQRVLDQVLWRRIQEMPSDARRLLETIAVAGQPTRMDVIYEAAGFEIRDPQILSRLRIDRLVRSSGPSLDSELEAYHDRIRETVVWHLPPDRKRQHHYALAESLERNGFGDAETLAVHFFGAEIPDRAGHYYAIAADKAAASLAFDHAANLYRQALALLRLTPSEDSALRARLAAALANAGRGEQSAIEYAAATEHASPEQKLELKRKSAYQFCISGHVEKGRSAITELLDSVGLGMTQSWWTTIGSLVWNRTALSLRGLKYTPRHESQVPKKVLEQVDLAWSAAAGMSMFDLINGVRLTTISLRLALRAGEPNRLVRSLCWEAAQRMNAGGSEIAAGDRLIAVARQIVQNLDDPYSLSMIPFAQGSRDFLIGNWSSSIAHLDAATNQFERTCVGVHWELGTARLFALYSMYWYGQLAEYHRRAHSLHQIAVDYGDFYAALSLGTFDLPFLSLAADRPDDAANWIEAYRGRLQLGRYSLQDMYLLVQSSNLDIYLDRPEHALERMLNGWKELAQSLLLRGETIHTVCWETRARAAIACLAKGIAPQASRREALRAIRALESRKVPRFSSLPLLLRAGLAAAERRTESSLELLEQGIQQAKDTHVNLYLHPAQWQLGIQLQSHGDSQQQSQRLLDEASAWMQSENIGNAARFATFLIPGFQR
jgi:serine/threonine protein kinase